MNRATAIAIVVALASGIAASVVTMHYTKIDSALPPGNGDAGERLSFECNGNQESPPGITVHFDTPKGQGGGAMLLPGDCDRDAIAEGVLRG
jgi:hypothetical protein